LKSAFTQKKDFHSSRAASNSTFKTNRWVPFLRNSNFYYCLITTNISLLRSC